MVKIGRSKFKSVWQAVLGKLIFKDMFPYAVRLLNRILGEI